MRKLNYLLSLLSLIMFLGLMNCTEKEDDFEDEDDPEFFTVDGAIFHSSDMPEGNDDIDVDVSSNGYIINGGTSIVTLNSQEALKSAYVAVEGIDGYYECTLKEIESGSGTRSTVRTYQVIVNLSQDASAGDFNIKVSVETIDGKISRIYTCGMTIVEAQTGELQINLSWDQLDDVDLHVFDPVGNHISYANPMAFGRSEEERDIIYFGFFCEWFLDNFDIDISSLDLSKEEDMDTFIDYLEEYGQPDYEVFLTYIERNNISYNGHLDIDSNASCEIDGINSENIYFPNPVQGEYIIAVDLFSKCNLAKPGSSYVVSLYYQGERIQFSNKQTGRFADSNEGNYDEPEGYIIIGSFTVGNGGNRSSVTLQQSKLCVDKVKSSWHSK